MPVRRHPGRDLGGHAASPRGRPRRVAGLRPVQWVGDVSYSLYLWHWPIFMFAPYITGMPSPPWLMVLLVVISLAVAGLSKRWIEDPFRARPRERHPGAARGAARQSRGRIAVVVRAGVVLRTGRRAATRVEQSRSERD